MHDGDRLNVDARPLAPLPRLRWTLALAGVLAGCGGDEPGPPLYAAIGQPIPGLEARDLQAFDEGRAAFLRQYTPADGLGPRFNENSCDACHTFPASGGTGETVVTKATRLDDTGRCDLLSDEGGENVRLRVTPEAAALGAARPAVPAAATHRARFTTPFVFGLGLVEAVAPATLEALADPEDADGDGISGRVGRDAAGRPARFGRKADLASLADFVEGAFRMEMGVTTPAHPTEARAGAVPAVPGGADPAPEPEVGSEELAAVVSFLRFLAPPEPAVVADPAEGATVEAGRALFASLGCAGCHVPLLPVGPDAHPAMAGRSVALYSDLLLHDMGPELEGSCAPGAATTEWRTEPLVGLRHRRLFLHDGRAGRVRDAILLHGGEAAGARERFAALDRVIQERLLRFLDTL